MAQSTRNINLDTQRQDLRLRVTGKQGDTNSRFVNVTILSDGVKLVIPTTDEAIINADRDDGESAAFACVINADGTVKAPITTWMLANEGQVHCSISVISGDESKLTTTGFWLDVEHLEYDGEDITEDENYNVLVSLIAQVSELLEGASTANIEVESYTKPTAATREPSNGQKLNEVIGYFDYKVYDMQNQIDVLAGKTGLTSDMIETLLALLEHVAYTDENGQQYYDALDAALHDKELLHIAATFDQGQNVIYDTASLDTLKQYLTVTAYYDDGTHANVSAYTLSGTLTAGSSTITVSYGGKTTTFTATVTAMYALYDYINYTGEYVNNNSSGVARLIRTKKYADLNSLKLDFDIMPNAQSTDIGTGVLGGMAASTNANQVSFYGKIDTGRVSVVSKGVQVMIEGVPNMQVGSRVHVTLNPGKVSPTTITADSLSATSAWGTYNTVNCSIGYFGKDMVEWQNTATITPNVAIGVLKVYDLDNNLVSEYKPCKRSTDNVIGIYDTVTGTFYTCATTTYAKVGHTNCVYAVGNWT